jgi:nitroreductase
MEAHAFNQLARNRRSTFPDQLVPGKKVDDNIIEEILTNALWAPNHGKQEPWHFTVFTGDGWNKLKENPLKASHIIALCMKRTLTKNIPEVEDIAAVACAVENIYLSVTAYGLGGYWTTGGVTYNEKAKPFFNLGEQDRLLGFFYIGHIAVPSTGATRATLEEKTSWVREE